MILREFAFAALSWPAGRNHAVWPKNFGWMIKEKEVRVYPLKNQK
tara:strand:- start:443 stop:577 length:135 start_codon:yes stop_codon:yes gene_type:complete